MILDLFYPFHYITLFSVHQFWEGSIFTENGDLKELNRTILANLIDEILVYEDKRIVIRFNYQDKYMQLLKIEEKLNIKEAV